MDTNQKEFNRYVFLSTFARNLIEVFIPIILFKFGYSLKEVILYYLLVNFFSFLISYPCVLFSKRFDNRLLSFVGIMSFMLVQLLLNKIYYSYLYIILLSFLYALYRKGYWIARRYYNLKIMRKENISKTYSIISVLNQIGVLLASYIGSLLLDFVSVKVLTFLSVSLFGISLFCLYKLKFEHEKNDVKINPFKLFKQIPKKNIYLFASYELLNVVKFLFSLYLFIYVKNNYQTIGLFNLITNVATIIFVYIYGKSINKDKNYLKGSILLTVVVFLLKANVTNIFLVLITFLEGVFTKMYELSINKEFYVLSKKYEYYNYNLLYEMSLNFLRSFVLLIMYLFINDLKVMIYITLLFFVIGLLINFEKSNLKDFKFGSDKNV